jgi:hypothetical protein
VARILMAPIGSGPLSEQKAIPPSMTPMSASDVPKTRQSSPSQQYAKFVYGVLGLWTGRQGDAIC